MELPPDRASELERVTERLQRQEKERALLDRLAFPHRLNQTIGVVGVSRLARAGIGSANKHTRTLPHPEGDDNAS